MKNIVLKTNCQLSTVSWLPIRTEYTIRANCQLSTVSNNFTSSAANSFFIKNIVLKTNCQLSTVSWLPIRTEYSIKAKCQLSTVSQLHSSAANSFFIKISYGNELSTVSWLPIRFSQKILYLIRTDNCQLSDGCQFELNILLERNVNFQLSATNFTSSAANSFYIKNIVFKTNCQLSTVSWLPIRTTYTIRAKYQLSTVSQLHSSASNSFFLINIVFKTNCQLSTVSWLQIQLNII